MWRCASWWVGRAALVLAVLAPARLAAETPAPVEIGSRLEPFVDNHLIDRLDDWIDTLERLSARR